MLPCLLRAATQPSQHRIRRQSQRAPEAERSAVVPCLMCSALSSRDLVPEAGEDRAGAAREELPELHRVSVAMGTAGATLYHTHGLTLHKQQWGCSQQRLKGVAAGAREKSCIAGLSCGKG